MEDHPFTDYRRAGKLSGSVIFTTKRGRVWCAKEIDKHILIGPGMHYTCILCMRTVVNTMNYYSTAGQILMGAPGMALKHMNVCDNCAYFAGLMFEAVYKPRPIFVSLTGVNYLNKLHRDTAVRSMVKEYARGRFIIVGLTLPRELIGQIMQMIAHIIVDEARITHDDIILTLD